MELVEIEESFRRRRLVSTSNRGRCERARKAAARGLRLGEKVAKQNTHTDKHTHKSAHKSRALDCVRKIRPHRARSRRAACPRSRGRSAVWCAPYVAIAPLHALCNWGPLAGVRLRRARIPALSADAQPLRSHAASESEKVRSSWWRGRANISLRIVNNPGGAFPKASPNSLDTKHCYIQLAASKSSRFILY